MTIALFGEDLVKGNEPWMRSRLAAVFHDKLVQTRRLDVVDQASTRLADTAASDSTNWKYDQQRVVALGKQVQARYALFVGQIRAEVRRANRFNPLQGDRLLIAIQAEVTDLETNLISESKTYDRSIPLEGKLAAAVKATSKTARLVLSEGDFGVPYATALAEIADEFIASFLGNTVRFETVVTDVSPTHVIIEGGAKDGLAAGAEFEIWAEGKPLILRSGEEVKQTSKIARVRVERVDEKVSYAQVTESLDASGNPETTPSSSRVARGMIAKSAPPAATGDAKSDKKSDKKK